MPVKSTSLNDQDLLVTKQIKSKFLIIHDIELLRINLREHIKCSLRFYCADSRNIRQSLVNIFTLLVNTSTRNNIIIYTLVSAESCLHNGLRRNVRAKTHVGKHLDSFDIVSCNIFIST